MVSLQVRQQHARQDGVFKETPELWLTDSHGMQASCLLQAVFHGHWDSDASLKSAKEFAFLEYCLYMCNKSILTEPMTFFYSLKFHCCIINLKLHCELKLSRLWCSKYFWVLSKKVGNKCCEPKLFIYYLYTVLFITVYVNMYWWVIQKQSHTLFCLLNCKQICYCINAIFKNKNQKQYWSLNYSL